MDKAQDLIKAFPGIPDHLANLERREAALKHLEAGDSLEMVIAIGGHEGAGEGQ